jgi:hypothetical protein
MAVAANLSHYHREHEKYYSEAPLGRGHCAAARGTHADRPCGTMDRRRARDACSQPVRRNTDLNDDRAIETSGVLFMEGGGEPAEITRIKFELQTVAASSEQSGSWLASATEASWAMAEALLGYPSSLVRRARLR